MIRTVTAVRKGLPPRKTRPARKFREVKLTSEQLTTFQGAVRDVAKARGYSSYQDWYNISYTDLKKKGGVVRQLVEKRGYVAVLLAAFPEHRWQVWRFPKAPTGWWQSLSSQRAYLDDFAKRNNINSPDDWYQVQTSDLVEQNGSTLLHSHNDSMYSVLTSAFPEHNWEPWKCSQLTKHYFEPTPHQRRFFDSLGRDLGFESLDRWYDMTHETIEEFGGSSILKGVAWQQALVSIYPHHSWYMWKFRKTTNHYWNSGDKESRDRLRQFFDKLGQELGFLRSLDGWYNVTLDMVKYKAGLSMLVEFKYNLHKALSAAYPDHTFLPWRFKQVPKFFWRSQGNVTALLDWLGQELGFHTPNDWYKLTTKMLFQHGVGKVLSEYSGSIRSLVTAAFPHHTWLPWKFSSTPRGFWNQVIRRNDLKVLEQYSNHLRDELKVGPKLEDWYSVSVSQHIDRRTKSTLDKLGGLYRLLRLVHPDHEWNMRKFFSKRSLEEKLFSSLKILYPGHSIVKEYRIPKPGAFAPVEFDLYLREANLALEYQGERHYFDLLRYGSCEEQSMLDAYKAIVSAISGIRLVEVPYWHPTPSTTEITATIAGLHR